MAKTFEFTAPDGKTYEVNAPDSATEEQAFAVLQSQLGSAAAQPAPKAPETSLLQDVGQGVADLGMGLLSGASNVGRGVLALPKLVGLPPVGGQDWHDESARKTKELMKDRGILGSAGELASEIAGTAGFGGPVARGASMLPKALGFASRSPVTKAAVEGAGAGAVLGQGEWTDVGTGAAGGAVGQKVIGGLSKVLSQPAKQTPQAEQLRRAGVDVTAGQGSSGGLVKSLEEASQYLPGAANPIRQQREQPYKQIRDMVARDVQPPLNPLKPGSPKSIPHGGSMDEVLVQARDDMGKMYDGVLKDKTFRPDAELDQVLADIHLSPKYTLADSNRSILARYMTDHLQEGRKAGGWTGEQMSVIRRNIDTKAAQQTNPEMAQALRDASDELLAMMSRQDADVGKVYQSLKGPYANLKTAEAAAKDAVNQGEFGVAALARAGESTGNQSMRNLGRLAATALKDDLNKGGTGLRTALGISGLGIGYAGGGAQGAAGTLALPGAMYLGLGTRTGQRVMSGQLKSQKKLAEFLRQNPEFGATTGAVAAVDTFGE